MTDQPAPSPVEILEEFFARKNVPDRPCPICEVDDWGVCESGTSDLSLIGVARDTPTKNPPPTMRLYVMVCQNCGFVRQHARRLVEGG